MALDLCKYYKKQEYVSYNNGLTWQPLDNYEKGELYESHSSSCGAGVFQYQWVQINNGYICDGKDRYTREIYQYSEDGEVWYNVWPTQYRKGTLVETNSPFCDNAANGQYSSGGTDPTSGDTEDCPPGYFWNGTECECNGQYIDGVCVPCPDNMTYNKTTHQCECIDGHLDNYGNCVICQKYEQWDDVRKECYCPTERDEYGTCKGCPPHSSWNERQHDCICNKWYEMRNGVCVYVDPLKIVKCEDSNGILTSSDVNYYESGWTVISYVIGDCITRIENGAFNGQTLMTTVTIPSSVTQVGSLAFGNCKSLQSITFPSTLTELGNSAFKGCEKLKTVNFGGSIPSTLNNAMFSGCTALEGTSWLSNVTSIGNNAFNGCVSLTSVTFSPSLSAIGYSAFFECRNLTNIVIPSATTGIDVYAFKNCSSLSNVVINSQNISIGREVFANCTSLTAVTVNSSGVTMGSGVFEGCANLVKITFTSPTPFAITNGFFDNTNECLLIVPCESLQAYKTAWSQYESRITCTDTGVYYRWVDDSGVYCDGYDEYTKLKQQSTTNGIVWTDTGVYRGKDLITHYSTNCGYVGEVALTVTNEDGYTRYYEPCD